MIKKFKKNKVLPTIKLSHIYGSCHCRVSEGNHFHFLIPYFVNLFTLRLRDLLFTSNADVLSKNISATILFHESVYHKTDAGVPFIEHLKKLGIIPGIKVDEGTVPLFGTNDETTVQGWRQTHENRLGSNNLGYHFNRLVLPF